VSAAFHSSQMEPAAAKRAVELEKVTFNDAKVPVVANVHGQIVKKAAEIKPLLVKQAASPVLWEDCMAKIAEFGVDTCVEVGPGKVLSGFTKKIAKNIVSLNVEDIPSLEKTLDYFREVR